MDELMQELKEMRIWFHWHWGQDKNGRMTKVPRSVNGGATGTTDNWAHTWVEHKDAVATVETQHADGVGFKIPDGYFFLDADDYAVDAPFMQTLLQRFDSYTEHSVSGGGIHIYGKCDRARLPITINKAGKAKLDSAFYIKNPHNRLELYIGGLTNRFAVYTDDVVWEQPLRDCTNAVLTTLDKNMRRSEKKNYSKNRDGDRITFDIICNLRKQKNGDKFRKLFDEGDISGYGSHSEADAALCALIAFRTGDDPDMIDTLFRQSALYREKWEREDYREATIALGISACNGEFHQSKMPHPYFIKFHPENHQPYVHVPLLAKYVRENMQYMLVRDNGKQGVLKYVYEPDGVYRLYSQDMFIGAIKRFIAEYDEELVKMSKVNEAYQHICTDLYYVRQDELNSREDIINFKNGLLKVTADSTELIPHSPDVYSTIQIPCEWSGKASPTPVFDSYMQTLTDGDKVVQELLLQFIGVCISNVKGWRMKKALFLVGSGDTGKSQLKSLVELLLGKGNFIGIDLKEIEARFGTGAVYGTRLAGSSDMSFLSVDELKTFKKMTGGDSLYAEFKGQQAFEFTYGGLLWFCMNRLPRFGGDDGQWVYDRIMAVNCPNVIPKDKQDKKLLEKMYAERDSIVYKAVKALQRVIGNGYRFTEPQSVNAAREQYKAENSTVVAFVQECMCSRSDGKITDLATTGRIYDVYRAWCNDNNHGYAKTAKEFREALAEYLGSTFKDISIHTNKGTFYHDLTLTSEAKEHYSRVYGYEDTGFLE